ncbi:MAG: hydrogenase expression/formation protein HypE [Gammaproteobacteria bacterium]|nr:hydrogenase expression/formation protein HypE [Pseudomonadota bacterium]TDJ18069.1 MAG: hydrogenase expression/formation protein HypE [Gammaproteobacteria bacterium]
MSAPADKTHNELDIRSRSGKVRGDVITLAHGSGGKAMRDLIDDVFLSSFGNDYLLPLEDQARLIMHGFDHKNNRLAFTTDSYVVDPLFFPGGNIGTLAVNGTINDLAVCGAKPLYLSCAYIIEEGFSVELLRTIADAMQAAAEKAGVVIVTGDTKVVQRGAADKLFINTAGIGIIPAKINISAHRAQAGDVIISNGYIGDHGAAIVDARGEFALENSIESDCQPLNDLIERMIEVCPDIHCLRDATRGGIATVLNEFAQASSLCMVIDESSVPIQEEVRGMCEILGLDPLYLANEGKLIAIVPGKYAESLLAAMRQHPAGQDTAIIGEVKSSPKGVVVLSTLFGGERIVDMLVGEQLPRIC